MPSGSIWVSRCSFGGCFLSFSSEPEVGSSTEGSCGGLLFSRFLGGSLSVKGRVPTEAGNDPQWGLSLLPLTKPGWVMREWRNLPGSHLIPQMWFPLVKTGRVLVLSQIQNQNLNLVGNCCYVFQFV